MERKWVGRLVELSQLRLKHFRKVLQDRSGPRTFQGQCPARQSSPPSWFVLSFALHSERRSHTRNLEPGFPQRPTLAQLANPFPASSFLWFVVETQPSPSRVRISGLQSELRLLPVRCQDLPVHLSLL